MSCPSLFCFCTHASKSSSFTSSPATPRPLGGLVDDLSLEPARARALGGMAMLIWFDKRKGGCEGKEGRVRASERASAFDDRCPLPWVSADRLWARGFARDGQSMESAVVASTSAVGATTTTTTTTSTSTSTPIRTRRPWPWPWHWHGYAQEPASWYRGGTLRRARPAKASQGSTRSGRHSEKEEF